MTKLLKVNTKINSTTREILICTKWMKRAKSATREKVKSRMKTTWRRTMKACRAIKEFP